MIAVYAAERDFAELRPEKMERKTL